MKLGTVLSLFMAGSIASTSAYAGSQRSVDARTFDVAGVKVGMDYDEVRNAIAEHFHIAVSDIKPSFLMEDSITHTKHPMFLAYEKGGVHLNVAIVGRVPIDKAHPLVVSQITYEEPWTPQNERTMANAALEKYGEPSNAPAKMSMEWCAKPSANPGVGCIVGDQAVLKLSSVTLTLVDLAWTNARTKFLQDSNATKPNF